MGWMNDPIADSPSPTNANGDVSSFTQQYGPLADKISEKLGVSSDLILGKLGLETAWGKKVIPGTNNLGNIKDVSGRGTAATDNFSGSRDAYLKFEDPETFGAYYSDFIQRLYPNAVGAGSDAKKFAEGLTKGKNGAYAEDPNYGSKVAQAAGLVSKTRGSAQGGWMNDPANEGTAPVTKVDRADIPPPPAAKAEEKPKAEEKKPLTRMDLLKQEGSKLFKRTDDLVRGLADAVTFGYADEIAAKLDSLTGGGQTGKTNYDDALKAQREIDKNASGFRTGGQVIGGLIPVVKGVQAAQGASRLARAGAGAATGTIQGALYGSGSAEGDLADRAAGALKGGATGFALGGTLGSVLPATAAQKGNEFIRKAGDDAAAKLDAEIVKDLSKIAGNTNNRGNPVQAVQANALEAKYIGDVQSAIKSFGKKGLEKLGTSADDINNALQNRRIITPEELQNLRTSKAGNALADAIEKAQRTRSLTAAVPAADNIIARTGRTVLDIAPIPQAVRYLGQRALGSRQTREDVIQKLLKDKNVAGAENVLERLGPSKATESLSALQQMAQKAQTASQARVAQEQAAKTASLAQKAMERNQVLKTSKMPLGGGFQELLPGGASGLNLTSDNAVKALRVVSKLDKESPVSKAAKEILQSGSVKNADAFYGVQNTIRKLSEQGKLPGVSTETGGVLSSGVRNPVSYQANVNNAMEAVKLAREAAPSKALGQFASTVAGTKAPAEKLKLVEARLAKATDPAEIEYLNNFVRPLTAFGKK